jgi:dGTP triphosphohydrolase
MSAARSRAARILGGLYRTLRDSPTVADDYLLLRFKQEEGTPYLRDVAPVDLAAEIGRRYRTNAAWARLVADHIAGMTDPFAIAEHERMVGP